DLAVGLLDHQVDVDRPAGVMDLVRDRAGDQRADRDRRDEVPVHHVDVNDPRARRPDLLDLGAEPREVGRQARWSDAPLPVEVAAVYRGGIGGGFHSDAPQHRVAAVLALHVLGAAHAADRLMLTAVRALRDQLEPAQAIDADEAPGQLRRAEPWLAA